MINVAIILTPRAITRKKNFHAQLLVRFFRAAVRKIPELANRSNQNHFLDGLTKKSHPHKHLLNG